MRSWSISLGRVFGIEVRLHLTFLFLLAFVWLTESAAHHAPPNPGRGVALVALVLASVLLHELGHALVSLRAGIRAKSVVLLPIGGVTMLDESYALGNTGQGAKNWARDTRIALAGPLVNFVAAAVSATVISAVLPQTDLLAWPFLTSSNLLRSLIWANLYLAAFNLLPAYPLDGGRILRAFFARKVDSVEATRRAVAIGQAIAMLFVLVGMLWNVWLAMVGFFLFIAAQLEERSVVFQSVLATVQMSDIMLTDFATLSPADTLEDALDKAVHSLQDDFPVIRGSDMVGVISKQKILQALRTQGNGYVQAVMSRIFEVAGRGETLASAFRKLTAKNLSIIPVVEDQRLVGIVTLQNLMHSMALLAESRKLRREA
ncbi:MAG: site-2 protease family protein [Acidobacteria bacterium]|nr:site-2 protease family protein [Acidobacteriota bacterium]MBV9480191.1 site-2 protease family protein [Acidobacteriota bacterium]